MKISKNEFQIIELFNLSEKRALTPDEERDLFIMLNKESLMVLPYYWKMVQRENPKVAKVVISVMDKRIEVSNSMRSLLHLSVCLPESLSSKILAEKRALNIAHNFQISQIKHFKEVALKGTSLKEMFEAIILEQV